MNDERLCRGSRRAQYTSTCLLILIRGRTSFARYTERFGHTCAKRGPKPKDPLTGRGGAHNDKIVDLIDQIKAAQPGWAHTNGGTLTEEYIEITSPNPAIPVGKRQFSARRPDITFQLPDGEVYRENVGLANAKGLPVNREVLELMDLARQTGEPVYWTAYNKTLPDGSDIQYVMLP